MKKYEISEMWIEINTKRAKFYERNGARPLKGMTYNSPLYWNRKLGSYCYPNFCYDPLRKVTKQERVRVSSSLVKEIIKRIMKTYYTMSASDKHVRRILRSIKTLRLEWREERYA